MEQNVVRRLEVLPGATDDVTCLTLILKNEDHTLGNALRYVIMKNPDVDVCSYGIPHPSEQNIYFRIQTHGAHAADVFKKGLEDLQKMCEAVTKSFKKANEDYHEAQEDLRNRMEAMNTDD